MSYHQELKERYCLIESSSFSTKYKILYVYHTIHWYTYIHTYITYITYLDIQTYIDIHTYIVIHTCMHAYIHTYIPTYPAGSIVLILFWCWHMLHGMFTGYVRTYIHNTCRRVWCFLCAREKASLNWITHWKYIFVSNIWTHAEWVSNSDLRHLFTCRKHLQRKALTAGH